MSSAEENVNVGLHAANMRLLAEIERLRMALELAQKTIQMNSQDGQFPTAKKIIAEALKQTEQ